MAQRAGYASQRAVSYAAIPFIPVAWIRCRRH
jgi:hypothetical protein